MIDTSANANKKEKKLEDKVFLDMLVTGRTTHVRELAETVLTKTILHLFGQLDSEDAMVDKRQIEEVIERVMKSLIELIPLEVQKYWHKLGPFFSFFYNMVKDFDLRRINYLNRVNLISLFIDLAGRFNAQIEYTVPPFDKLVATVCILARYQPIVIHLFGIPQEF